MLETVTIWGLIAFATSVLIRMLTAEDRLQIPPDPDRCPHCGAGVPPAVPFPKTVCRRCGRRR